jgi:hypothetical protein
MPERPFATLSAVRQPDVCEIDVDAGPLPVVRNVSPAAPGMHRGWFQDCDPLALVSAACGLTALIPIVSQVDGLALGVLSLIRIRSARRQGVVRRGTGWAWTGIVSSGFMLLVWGFVIAVMIAVGGTFAHVARSLPAGG